MTPNERIPVWQEWDDSFPMNTTQRRKIAEMEALMYKALEFHNGPLDAIGKPAELEDFVRTVVRLWIDKRPELMEVPDDSE